MKTTDARYTAQQERAARRRSDAAHKRKRAAEYRETGLADIVRSAKFNGKFLTDALDNPQPEMDDAAIATARAMSLLITMREWARGGMTINEQTVQAAIDAWMEGAGMDTKTTPMGAEVYVRKAGA